MRGILHISLIAILLHIFAMAGTAFSQPQNSHDSIAELVNAGISYNHSAQIGISMEYLQQAYALSIKTGDSSKMADIYMYLAENYKSIDACEEANEYYRKACNIYEAANDKANLTFAQYCIANNYERRYESSDNPAYLDSAIAIIQPLHKDVELLDEAHFVVTNLIVSRILLAQSDAVSPRKAKAIAKEALDIIKEGEALMRGYDMHEYKEYFKFNKIAAYMKLEEMDNARNVFNSINEDSLSLSHLPMYYPIIIKYCKKTGNYERALQYLLQEKHLVHITYNAEHARQSQEHNAKIQYETTVKKIDQEDTIRNYMFQIRKQNNRIKNSLLAVAVLIMGFITIMLIRDTQKIKKQNIALRESKEEIENKNRELQAIHDTIEQQRQELSKQCETIIQQTNISKLFKHRMGEAMRLAKSIQDALMPSNVMMTRELHEHFIHWKPVAPVSGDFYWMRSYKKYTYLICADCTGHSVPGALLSMLGISTLNDLAATMDMEDENTTPAILLNMLKKRFTESLHVDKNHIGDSIDLSLIRIDKKKKEIHYAGANRPLLLIRANEAMDFKPTKMCIGYNVIERPSFTNNVIDYEPDDMLYMFTDGLTDQFGDTDGHTKFGSKRFYELLSNIADLPCDIQKSAIAANMNNWMNIDVYKVTADQIDDQLIIGIRME